MWDDEDDEDFKKLTPKQRLLGWIQNKVPELPINNFNKDWRDGKALGALVDNCAPGKFTFWHNHVCMVWLWAVVRKCKKFYQDFGFLLIRFTTLSYNAGLNTIYYKNG